MKNKLEKCESEVESNRKANELNLLPFGGLTVERFVYYLMKQCAVFVFSTVIIPIGFCLVCLRYPVK